MAAQGSSKLSTEFISSLNRW